MLLAAESDMIMRAFVLNTLNVTEADPIAMRKHKK
jgi:hypothetical protein